MIVAVIVFIGRFLWRICIFGNGCKIEADIRNEMFRHMEKMSPTYFSKNKTGALMALYTNDLQTIRQSLPADFQTANYLMKYGQIDIISSRAEMKSTISKLISLHKK